MGDSLEQFKQTLKDASQSITRPRLVVFEALQDKEPQTIAELLKACRGQLDRASLYRTIAIFERLGITHRLQIGWKYKIELSDIFHHHHHHMTCESCGKTIPLPEDIDLEQGLQRLARQAQFVMRGHQLEIQGLCQNCQHNPIKQGYT